MDQKDQGLSILIGESKPASSRLTDAFTDDAVVLTHPFTEIVKQDRQVQKVLANDPAIEEVYYSNPNWLDQYGLPTAYHEFDILTAIRTQRAVFQHWATDGRCQNGITNRLCGSRSPDGELTPASAMGS